MKTLLTPLAFLALSLTAYADFPIGPEFLPSYIDRHESKLIVPARETVTLSGAQDIDAIEVRGELNIPGELTLKYINLTVAEGGKLTIGTAAVPNVSKVELIKKDVALDTTFDPFQWGHGLQVFGELTIHGRDLGATWSGETANYQPSDWNITFRSENPNEVMHRGHTAVIHTGHADVRFASFIGMGRTTGQLLDNTKKNADGTIGHVGSNQIAKYAFHWHHAAHHGEGDHSGGHLIGCYLDGLNGNKWGVVIHGSHGMHVENNVVANFTGSCIVTEDGNENGYLIKSNLCTGSKGNADGSRRNARTNMLDPTFSPGAEGAGIWHHSPTGTTINNVCKGNNIGYQMMYIPNPNKLIVPPRISPTKFDGNKAIGNEVGLEEWRSGEMVIDNLVCTDNHTGVFMGGGEPGSVTLNNPQFTGTGSGSGVRTFSTYSDKVEIHGGKISGFEFGVKDADEMLLDGLDVRGNTTDLRFELIPPETVDINNTFFDTCFFGRQPAASWTPDRPLTADEFNLEWHGEGPRIWLRNRNGDGKTYALFAKNFQDGASPAPYQCPTPGLTRKQCWDRYGFAALGYVYGSNAIELPGIPLARAVEMSSFSYQTPPKAVLVSPSQAHGFLGRSFVILTGGAKSGFIQFDNGPIVSIRETSGWPTYKRLVTYPAGGELKVGFFANGSHVGRTWAGDASGQRIESSLLEFPFVIGDNPTPPPVEVWEPATIDNFNGDATLRVRNGLIEKRKAQ